MKTSLIQSIVTTSLLLIVLLDQFSLITRGYLIVYLLIASVICILITIKEYLLSRVLTKVHNLYQEDKEDIERIVSNINRLSDVKTACRIELDNAIDDIEIDIHITEMDETVKCTLSNMLNKQVKVIESYRKSKGLKQNK